MIAYFCEEEALRLFNRYRENEDPAALDALVRFCMPIIVGIINRRNSTLFENFDELFSVALQKLGKILPRYNPARGRLFSYVTKATERVLITAVISARARNAHFLANGYELLEAMVSLPAQEDHSEIKKIACRIARLKTPRTDPAEREIQRTIVRMLLDTDFAPPRHKVAEVLTKIYRVSPKESRKLYDITLLAIRRELLDERRLRPVDPSRLIHVQAKPLLRYRSRLSPLEFARLVFLMKSLAPILIEEFSLGEILYGFASEEPLFNA